MAVNTWAISVMRYGAGILKWNTDELKSVDRRTRKFMTIHGELHPKSYVDRVCLSRKMRRRETGKLSGVYRHGRKQFGMVCQKFCRTID